MIGVLLAGGKGTRLGADPVSKPMVDVGDRPLYRYGLDALADVGCRRMTVVTGDNADLLADVRSLRSDKIEVADPERVAETILASLAALGPFDEDVAMCFGDEWYDLEAVQSFRKAWNGIPAAILFFVHGKEIARKTYTALGETSFATPGLPMLRVHRLIEKPKWVPQDRTFGYLAGTGLAIVRKEVANAAVDLSDRSDWVDLFQAAVDDGLSVFAVPFAAPYHNVNTTEDLAALRGFAKW